MYEQWQEDPSSLSEEWRLFFSGLDLAAQPTGAIDTERAADQSKVVSIIFAYRNLGHLIADLDPLGVQFFYVRDTKFPFRSRGLKSSFSATLSTTAETFI